MSFVTNHILLLLLFLGSVSGTATDADDVLVEPETIWAPDLVQESAEEIIDKNADSASPRLQESAQLIPEEFQLADADVNSKEVMPVIDNHDQISGSSTSKESVPLFIQAKAGVMGCSQRNTAEKLKKWELPLGLQEKLGHAGTGLQLMVEITKVVDGVYGGIASVPYVGPISDAFKVAEVTYHFLSGNEAKVKARKKQATQIKARMQDLFDDFNSMSDDTRWDQRANNRSGPNRDLPEFSEVVCGLQAVVYACYTSWHSTATVEAMEKFEQLVSATEAEIEGQRKIRSTNKICSDVTDTICAEAHYAWDKLRTDFVWKGQARKQVTDKGFADYKAAVKAQRDVKSPFEVLNDTCHPTQAFKCQWEMNKIEQIRHIGAFPEMYNTCTVCHQTFPVCKDAPHYPNHKYYLPHCPTCSYCGFATNVCGKSQAEYDQLYPMDSSYCQEMQAGHANHMKAIEENARRAGCNLNAPRFGCPDWVYRGNNPPPPPPPAPTGYGGKGGKRL